MSKMAMAPPLKIAIERGLLAIPKQLLQCRAISQLQNDGSKLVELAAFHNQWTVCDAYSVTDSGPRQTGPLTSHHSMGVTLPLSSCLSTGLLKGRLKYLLFSGREC